MLGIQDAPGRPAAPDAQVDPRKVRRHLSRTMTRTIAGFGLIRAGDRVLVAVSGGKDSYTLLRR